MILLLAPLARAQELRVVPIDGESWSARALAATPDGVIHSRDFEGIERATPLDDLESIEVGGTSALPNRGAGHVWLRSGPDFGARVAGGDEHLVTLDIGLGQPAGFSLVHLRALRLGPATAAGGNDGFERALAHPDPTADLLFAWDRDRGRLTRLPVHVLRIGADEIEVEWKGEPRSLPTAQVHGLVFGSEVGVVPPEPGAPSLVVVTGDGAQRIAGTLLAWTDDAVRIRTPEQAELTIPLAAVARIIVRSSRIRRLASVPPSEVLQTAAIDRVRPWLVDRAPGGEGLLLGSRHYTRGICAFPYTRLSWELDPGAGFTIFETTIGIDARSSGPADAVFRVSLDGELVFERSHVDRQTVESLRIPTRDARVLSIEVDFGETLDLGDHCVFADPRLLRG